MPLWTTLALAALIGCSVVVMAYWGVILAHIALTARQIPTARAGLRSGGGGAPRVLVVVPAHNEEAVIGGLAESLAAQDYPRDRLRLLFALDRCTDRTKEIVERTFAGDGRVEVIEIASCPEGWSGKVHAMCSALQRSAARPWADLLLFADADTIFDPACVRATAALMQERELDLLSLLSTQRTKTWFEWVVQPAVCLELIRQYPIRKANSQRKRRPFANGQFMLFRREAYERIGGHESVKEQIFEDVHIARVADRNGLNIGVVLADGLLHCRMYRDWASFRRGWKRIFSEAANLKLSRLRRASWRLRLVGAVLPISAAAGAAWGWSLWRGGESEGAPLAAAAMIAGIAALAVYAASIVGVLRAARTPLAAGVFFPIGAWMTAEILGDAAADLAARRPTVWAGRAYERAAR